ncbi:MAG TPA: peptidylprolyl isomerase [Nitrospiraceae bacterium]
MHIPPSTQHPAFGIARTALACAMLAASGCTQASSDESHVVAMVNGTPITQSEFDVRWAELPESRQARYQREGGKKKFLEDMIARELLLQEARRLGLDQTTEIREKVQRFREQLALDELVQEMAKTQGHVSQEEMEDYYMAHSSAVLATEHIRASQIIVPTAVQALEVRKQLENGGDFSKLAQQVSIDQATKFRGGDLGPYRKGAAPPEIEAAILTQTPGTVSEPIKVAAGFALVKVTSRDPLDARSAHIARERLRQELYAENRRKQFEEFLEALHRKASIRMMDASRIIPDAPGQVPGVPTVQQ